MHIYDWTDPSCWACTMAADAARTAKAYLMVCIIIANAFKARIKGGEIIIRDIVQALYTIYRDL